MNTLRQAAQAAVDAFAAYQNTSPDTPRELRAALYQLEEALAQPDASTDEAALAEVDNVHQ